MSLSEQTSNYRSVVARVGALLDAISASPVPLTLSEISVKAGMPLTTTHRLLNELVDAELVSKSDKRFVLNLRLFEIAVQIPWIRKLREIAEPTMHRLASATDKTVNLAILKDLEVVYLAKIEGPGAPNLPSRIGGRLPAHCTALGKLLLANLDAHDIDRLLINDLGRMSPYTTTTRHVLDEEFEQIRKRGVAFDREEVSAGLFCVAAPVKSHHQVVAALSISGRTPRVHDRPNIRRLQLSASQVGRDLDRSSNQNTIGN